MESNQALQAWKLRIDKGDRNIALSNVGHINSQQKYLLAILTYLGQVSNFKKKKVGLVSFDLKIGLYKDYFDKNYSPSMEGMSVPSVMGTHFIDWNFLIQKKIPAEMLDDFDLLLWDLPDLNFININSHGLERFFKEFDSMLIVSMRPNGIGNDEFIKRIHTFYQNHGLLLPKLIVSSSTEEVRTIKKTDKIRSLLGL